jgi:hypothetical protein
VVGSGLLVDDGHDGALVLLPAGSVVFSNASW